MKRVIVTGASGFVGRHALAPLQSLGFEVHAVDLPGSARVSSDQIVWHSLDLLDPAAVGRLLPRISATHLLHFAWYAKHGEFWTARENLAWVAASLNLIRVFHRAGGERAVLAGTCAEYDWSDTAVNCNERWTRLRPHTMYGAAKNALRAILEAYSAEKSLQWAWGRLFLLYGPDEHPARLVPSLLRPLMQGERARCRSANLVRDLMHVEDAGRAFAALADSEVVGPVNIATGTPASLGEVAREIARQCGAEDRLDLEEQPCSPSVPARLVADTRRLHVEVGFHEQIPLHEGIRRLVAALRT
jgi:nucleoside-diphosphate-sugar epimerase